jgi:hypothetical protein
MNLNLSGIGAEPKKIGILVALLAVAAYFYFSGRNSGLPASGPRPAAPEVSQTAVPVQPQAMRPATHARSTGKGFDSGLREFRPSLKFKDIDPASVDPTLHLDLLAKLRQVEPESGSRSLFEISAPPVEIAKLKEPAKIKPTPVGPIAPAAPATPPGPPPAPKAPPIPLKFYGFVDPSKADNKRAFFLDGDDIVIASEGETIKKRYKVIRIGVNSAVLEDTQFKSNNQQTLPLEAELAG